MKNIELKNCPNCDKRIGIHDVECPYCKYIDDPKYKKHNDNLLKKKKRRKNNKKNIYKTTLLIPIICYLVYLLFNINSFVIILPLILLNIMCFFTKKDWTVGIIFIEIIALMINFINNIANNLKLEIIILLLGLIFILIPKIIYITKSKKNKKKKM